MSAVRRVGVIRQWAVVCDQRPLGGHYLVLMRDRGRVNVNAVVELYRAPLIPRGGHAGALKSLTIINGEKWWHGSGIVTGALSGTRTIEIRICVEFPGTMVASALVARWHARCHRPAPWCWTSLAFKAAFPNSLRLAPLVHTGATSATSAMGSGSESEWSSSDSKALQMCVLCGEDDDSVGDRQSCDTCERWFCTSDPCAKEMLGHSFDKKLRSGDIECSACKAERKAKDKR